MRAPAMRPGRRYPILVLCGLVAAGLAAAALVGAAPSEVAEAADDEVVAGEAGQTVTKTLTEDGVVATTAEPEQLGIDLGAIAPTWTDMFTTLGIDGTVDVVATAQRTVYTTGSVWSGSSYDLELAKYVGGELRWTRSYAGPAGGGDTGRAIAARGGRIYTAGYRQTKWGDLDLLVIRWDSSGNRVWTRAYDSGSRSFDTARDIAVDGDGNVVVVGLSHRPASNYDWVVISYRPNGTRRWVRRYDGPSHLEDDPAKMLIDARDRIYVAGYSRSSARGLDALLLKYSQSGTKLWAKRHNGSANLDDGACSLCARPGGGVYVCGYTASTTTGIDGLLLAYTSAGSRLFVTVDTGTVATTTTQVFSDLAVRRDRYVVCGGYDCLTGTDRDRLYVAFDATGAAHGWNWLYSDYDERITAMARDGQGGVYLTGTMGTATGAQALTQRLCEGGTTWSCRWPNSPTSNNVPAAIAVNGVNAYVVGSVASHRFVVGHVY